MKAPIDKYYATTLLGAAELIGAFMCVLLVHLTGKRPLVFASLIGTGFCFFATATYAYFLDAVPGVAVDNVVANYSMKDLDRTSYINQRNLTEIINNSTDGILSMISAATEQYETTTEFIDGTTEFMETTTEISKHMSLALVATAENTSNEPIDSSIFLQIPNVKANDYSWIPLTLLIAGAVFSHVGKRFGTFFGFFFVMRNLVFIHQK